MLNETLSQPYLFGIFLLAGVVGGIVFDIANFVKFLFANKKIPTVILDFFATSLCLTIIFFVNLKLNCGLVRVFPFLCFMLSFCIERFTIGKLIAKIYLSCYNFLTKLNKRIWRRKSAKANKND